jgi:predicted alpha/beta-hydrolase family hydrolase
MPNAVQVESFSKPLDPRVRGYLHLPESSSGDALILTHGAGGNSQAPLLRALADTFAEACFTVLRCDLPYRQARSFGPPGPADAARDRDGLRNAIAEMKKLAQGRIFLGGHSYGGRQSSMLCAELSKDAPDLVAGLLLLSYPLHPPRRPEQQRTQHLPDLHTATLFVHGTRDPFGAVEELQRAIKMIPAATKLVTVEGTGHDLGFKGKARAEDLPRAILREFQTLLEGK